MPVSQGEAMNDRNIPSNECLYSGMPEVEWLAILTRDDKYASVEYCDVAIQDRRSLIAAVKRMAARLAQQVETHPADAEMNTARMTIAEQKRLRLSRVHLKRAMAATRRWRQYRDSSLSLYQLWVVALVEEIERLRENKPAVKTGAES